GNGAPATARWTSPAPTMPSSGWTPAASRRCSATSSAPRAARTTTGTSTTASWPPRDDSPCWSARSACTPTREPEPAMSSPGGGGPETMTAKEPLSERNLDGYDAPPIAWARVRERLDQGVTQPPGTGGPDRPPYWLATTNPDGSPHVMPLGVFWVDGAFYFNAGPGTRKA